MDVFSLLGEGWRLRLLVAGKLCTCDLAAMTGMSASAVSYAPRRLRAHRVVVANRRGRMAFDRFDDEQVRILVNLGLAAASSAPSR